MKTEIKQLTAHELILKLQEAGITNEYVNKILNEVKIEKQKEYEKGRKHGFTYALNLVYDKFKSAHNFNTQYLKEWVTKLSLKWAILLRR